MRRNFWLVLGALFLAALIALPAKASWAVEWHAGEDLHTALGAGDEAKTDDTITVDNVDLDRQDLVDFYTARDFQPAWDFAGPANEAAFTAFLDSIQRTIDWHGLVREDYPLDEMRKLATADNSDSRTQLELLVTGTLLHLARDLHGDDIDLDTLYPGWNFHRDAVDIPAGLANAVAANAVNTFIDGLAPQSTTYQKLGQALQQYRDIQAKGAWPLIDAGRALHVKDHDKRVAQLRARLTAEGYLPASDMSAKQAALFDDDLHKALMDYQTRNGLNPDGNAGTRTIQTLNVPIATRIDQIRANMERWRHMPDKFPPDRYVMVNIPEATVRIAENGSVIYEGPVIVGQVERKTPFIDSEVRSMIVNPAWHVPSKIAREDILPKLRKDPHYLEKLGFTIKGSEKDPHGKNIDWNSVSDEEFDFHLRQDPGKLNSLGRLKFDFDNDFAVYMHGTPHQELFKKNERTLSSGCVRLRDPEKVAEILLAGNPGNWDAQHIEDAIATKKTHWVGLKNPIPIFIVYWTVFADADQKIEFRDDAYSYDQFLMESLHPTQPPEAEKTDAAAKSTAPTP